MIKKFLLFLMLLVSLNSFSMELQDQLSEKQNQFPSLTLDTIPEEIRQIILSLYILKSSIDELPVPISGNDCLEEPQHNDIRLLDFIQRYAYLMKNLKLINKTINNSIINLQSYINYFLVLKLSKLTIDQKCNALLSFIELKNSNFIVAALLSFLDLTKLNPGQIDTKFNLLKNALKQKIILCGKFKPRKNSAIVSNKSANYVLEIPDVKKIDCELLNLLIEIRSSIPLVYNSTAYFGAKLTKHGSVKALSPFEKKCYKYLIGLQNKSIYSLKNSFDLFNLNNFFEYYIHLSPNYCIPILRELTKINFNNLTIGQISPLMMAAFNNDLSKVIHLIEHGHDKEAEIHNMTAIRWALLGKAKETLDYLLTNDKITNQAWVPYKHLWNWAIRNCDVDILEYLLEKLRKKSPSYELSEILSHKVNYIRDKKWEEPIKCSYEEKLIFLLNCGIPLTKFDFTSFAQSNSKMMCKLYIAIYKIESLNNNFEKLKAEKGIDIVTPEDIIEACDITDREILERQAKQTQKTFVSPQNNNNEDPDEHIFEDENDHLNNQKSKHNLTTLDIVKRVGFSVAIFGVIGYLIFSDKILPFKDSNSLKPNLSNVLKR